MSHVSSLSTDIGPRHRITCRCANRMSPNLTLYLLHAGPVQRPQAGEPFWSDLRGVQPVGQEQASRHLLQDPLAHGPRTESGPAPISAHMYFAPPEASFMVIFHLGLDYSTPYSLLVPAAVNPNIPYRVTSLQYPCADACSSGDACLRVSGF